MSRARAIGLTVKAFANRQNLIAWHHLFLLFTQNGNRPHRYSRTLLPVSMSTSPQIFAYALCTAALCSTFLGLGDLPLLNHIPQPTSESEKPQTKQQKFTLAFPQKLRFLHMKPRQLGNILDKRQVFEIMKLVLSNPGASSPALESQP